MWYRNGTHTVTCGMKLPAGCCPIGSSAIQLLKAAATPGSPWMLPTTKPSGSSHTSQISPSTFPHSPSLPLLLSHPLLPSVPPSLGQSTSRFSSIPPPTTTARPLHAEKGHFRLILPVLSTTTWMRAVTQARRCLILDTQTGTAAAAMNSARSRLRPTQAQHLPCLVRESTSSVSPWAPTTL